MYRELSADIYPIETVYATIEVKGVLERKEIDKSFEHIAYIRELAKCKNYVRYVGRPKNDNEPDKLIVKSEKYNFPLSPRSYIFAYAKKNWRTLDNFKSYLKESLEKHSGAHLHGIMILEKNWFAFQEPHSENNVEIHVFNDNALIRFTNTLLRGIQSMPMDIASIDDYHRAGLYEGFLAGDPSESAYPYPEPPDATEDL